MTLKDVARLAGVSNSAVSRYLNGGPLSEEKRAAIRAVVEKTGYFPNQAAHTLRTGRIRLVGVIVPKIHSETVSQVVSGVSEALSDKGYLPVLGSSGRETAREGRYLEMMRAYHVAGMILMSAGVTEEALALYHVCPLPLVITGQRIPGMSWVCHDDRNAMRELTRRMLRRGRRKIAYLGVDPIDEAVGQERLRGARDAVREAGLPEDTLRAATADFDWEAGRACMQEMLCAHPDTDGVLCATDAIALGALMALKDAGRNPPEDVSIAGVGDDWADLMTCPRLTTVRLSQEQCGREAAEILLRLLAEPDSGPWQITLGYEIVERGSL